MVVMFVPEGSLTIMVGYRVPLMLPMPSSLPVSARAGTLHHVHQVHISSL
jgi:hypothetical protein